MKSAIIVRGACKSFGEDTIIKNFDMTVESSTIYSLLGSSGCGKTTLLNCIMGNTLLDSGTVELNIESRLNLGYMPQELALYEDLHIAETFRFFGLLYNIPYSDSINRCNELTVLLDLPNSCKRISKLSGGEKRRVSLAISLMANPTLLILDEPTVGLDSVLRDSIWNHLFQLTEQGKTIVITTHYIEEARGTHKVGFMRNGCLMIEGEPLTLMEQAGVETLEQLYLQLSQNQDMDIQDNHSTQERSKELNHWMYKNDTVFSGHRILAFVLKTMYWIKNNLMLFYVSVLLPSLLYIILVETTRAPNGLKVSYVNFEDDCSQFDGVGNYSCDTPLSCRYIGYLGKQGLQLIGYPDLNDAIKSVKDGKSWAAVWFHYNFTYGVKNRLEYFYNVDHKNISDDDEARIWMDMSSYPISYQIKRSFYDSYLDSIQDWFTDCGWNPKSVHPIFRLEEPIYGSTGDRGLMDTMTPALVVLLPSSTACTLAMIFLVGEFELGTHNRCKAFGLKFTELVISQLIAVIFLVVPQSILVMCVMYVYIGINGSIIAHVSLLLLEFLVASLQGIFFTAVFNNFNAALHLVIVYQHVASYLSGALWPTQGFHWLARVLSWILPVMLPVKSYLAMINRGSTILNDQVYGGFIHSIIWIIILSSVLCYMSKKR